MCRENNLKQEIEYESLKQKISHYEKRKAKEDARKKRFIQKRKELGYSHISSLWVHLDPIKTKILKQGLKDASEKQLLYIIDFLEDKTTDDNNEEKKISKRTLLKNELTKYIQLKQNNRTKETLKDLSIRLMEMSIYTKSRKNKRKIRFSTGSLSRMITKISDQMRMDH